MIRRADISVVMCTFNGSSYLSPQFESILRQTVMPHELIVSDDGSTDATRAMVEKWLVRAENAGIRTTFLDGPKKGVSANFEAAIARSTGGIIVLSDQDDVWSPERLEKTRAIFESRPEALLHHANARLVDGEGRRLGLSLFEALHVSALDLATANSGNAFSLYLRRNLATGAVTALRRDLFDLAQPFPEEWIHDEWLAIIAASVGGIRATSGELIDYRQHQSNVIGVRRATLRHKVRTTFGSTQARNASLATRATVLRRRLESQPAIAEAVVRDARAKEMFETRRALIPARRPMRVLPILLIGAADYRRYASQGLLDMVRDLLQLAGPRNGATR